MAFGGPSAVPTKDQGQGAETTSTQNVDAINDQLLITEQSHVEIDLIFAKLERHYCNDIHVSDKLSEFLDKYMGPEDHEKWTEKFKDVFDSHSGPPSRASKASSRKENLDTVESAIQFLEQSEADSNMTTDLRESLEMMKRHDEELLGDKAQRYENQEADVQESDEKGSREQQSRKMQESGMDEHATEDSDMQELVMGGA